MHVCVKFVYICWRLYVCDGRCRAQPTLHQCVVLWAREGMRYVWEAIGKSTSAPFETPDLYEHVYTLCDKHCVILVWERD